MTEDFAVIKLGPKQEIIKKGDEISVAKLDASLKDKKVIEEVLLISKSGKVEVGTPFVKGAKVEVQIISQDQGEKVEKRTFKAKARERRHIGSRQKFTTIKILSI